MALFKQAPEVQKNWLCLGCKRKFKKKGNVISHQRMTTTLECKRKGYKEQQQPKKPENSLTERKVQRLATERISVKKVTKLDTKVEVKRETTVEVVNQQKPNRIGTSRQGVRPWPPLFKIRVVDWAKIQGKEGFSKRGMGRKASEHFGVPQRTAIRWIYETPDKTYDEWVKLAKRKKGEIFLPDHCKQMSKTRIRRADLEDLVIQEYEERRFVKKLACSFKWFKARFDHHFREAGEKLPSKNKITCCFRRKDITLQRARDTKPKTVEERIHVAREHLVRLDGYYRGKTNNKKRDLVYGRVPLERNFAFDEYSGVMFRKDKTTYNPKGSKSCHVRVPANLDTRQLSVLPLFCFGTKQLPFIAAILPLQPKKFFDDEKKLVGWDVTQPASAQILVEMEGWPKNVRVYFWKSGLCREPVMRQLGVDFEV